MDPGATGSFAFVVLVFLALRLKTRAAIAAKDARLRVELDLQEAKVAALKGEADQ